VHDVASTVEPGSPEVQVVLDRERAAALGVSADALGQSLRRQIRGEIVGQFREGEERLDIRLRAAESSRERAQQVEALPIRLPGGTVVPVAGVAQVTIDRGPAAIHRGGGARMAEVTARAGLVDLGQTLERVGGAVAATELPPGTTAELAGQDQELAVSFRSLKLMLALAIFLVYVVMAMQFESFLHPFVLLLAVPLGLVGAVAALFVTGTSINVLALIGIVILCGIVVNNAIILVDAVNRRRREERQAIDDALVGAGRERLRPILMTTCTTVLGLLPMALGLGAGDELRRPLAITVIGGLSVATVLTLVIIPCLYRLVARTPAAPVPAPAAALPGDMAIDAE
jgi:multidrug efflux pump subunit AcrB